MKTNNKTRFGKILKKVSFEDETIAQRSLIKTLKGETDHDKVCEDFSTYNGDVPLNGDVTSDNTHIGDVISETHTLSDVKSQSVNSVDMLDQSGQYNNITAGTSSQWAESVNGDVTERSRPVVPPKPSRVINHPGYHSYHGSMVSRDDDSDVSSYEEMAVDCDVTVTCAAKTSTEAKGTVVTIATEDPYGDHLSIRRTDGHSGMCSFRPQDNVDANPRLTDTDGGRPTTPSRQHVSSVLATAHLAVQVPTSSHVNTVKVSTSSQVNSISSSHVTSADPCTLTPLDSVDRSSPSVSQMRSQCRAYVNSPFVSQVNSQSRVTVNSPCVLSGASQIRPSLNSRSNISSPSVSQMPSQGRPTVKSPSVSQMNSQNQSIVNSPSVSQLKSQNGMSSPSVMNSQSRPYVNSPSLSQMNSQNRPNVNSPSVSQMTSQNRAAVISPGVGQVNSQDRPGTTSPSVLQLNSQSRPTVTSHNVSQMTSHSHPGLTSQSTSQTHLYSGPLRSAPHGSHVNSPRRNGITSTSVSQISSQTRPYVASPNADLQHINCQKSKVTYSTEEEINSQNKNPSNLLQIKPPVRSTMKSPSVLEMNSQIRASVQSPSISQIKSQNKSNVNSVNVQQMTSHNMSPLQSSVANTQDMMRVGPVSISHGVTLGRHYKGELKDYKQTYDYDMAQYGKLGDVTNCRSTSPFVTTKRDNTNGCVTIENDLHDSDLGSLSNESGSTTQDTKITANHNSESNHVKSHSDLGSSGNETASSSSQDASSEAIGKYPACARTLQEPHTNSLNKNFKFSENGSDISSASGTSGQLAVAQHIRRFSSFRDSGLGSVSDDGELPTDKTGGSATDTDTQTTPDKGTIVTSLLMTLNH